MTTTAPPNNAVPSLGNVLDCLNPQRRLCSYPHRLNSPSQLGPLRRVAVWFSVDWWILCEAIREGWGGDSRLFLDGEWERVCGCREREEVERDSEEADELEMIIFYGVFDFFRWWFCFVFGKFLDLRVAVVVCSWWWCCDFDFLILIFDFLAVISYFLAVILCFPVVILCLSAVIFWWSSELVVVAGAVSGS